MVRKKERCSLEVVSQEELAASEERYRLLFESAGDAMAVVEADGLVTMVNSRFQDLLGYSKEEAEGKLTVVDLVHEDDLEGTLKVRQRRLESGTVTHHQVRLRCKDGSVKLIDVTGVLIPGTQRSFVSFRDVTEARRLQEELAARNRELEALNAVAASLSRAASLDQVLKQALTTVVEVMQVKGAVILLLNEASGRLFVRAAHGFSRKFIAGIDEIALGEGFSGRVVQTGQPIFVADLGQDPRLTRRVVLDRGIRSGGFVPLLSAGRVLGTLAVSGGEARQFTPEEQRLLVSIGDEIGVVVERARLFEEARQRVRELEVLNAVTTGLSREASLERMLKEALASVVRLMRLKGGIVFLPDEAGRRLVVKASYGLSAEFVSAVDNLALGEGLNWQVVQTGQPIFVLDVSQDPRLARRGVVERELKGHAFVPLVSGGKVLGALSVGAREPHTFTPEEQRLLVSIGNQIGVAVERARFFEEAHNRSRELEALASVARELVSTLDLPVLLDRTLAIMCQQVRADNAFLCLLDEEKGELTAQAFWGEAITPPGRVWKIGEGITGWVAQHRQVIVSDDLATDPRIQGSQGPAMGYSSAAAIPLEVKGKLLGVVVVVGREKAAFAQVHLPLLSTYAADAAIAIENALLHERIRRLAGTDELTQLANRRALYQRLGEELRRVKRYERPLALLFADVDGLKGINDRYGHLQGDVLLRWVAATILQAIRETDLAARFGGDEFVVILPETEREEAQRVVERLLAGVSPCELAGELVSWSMSVGLAWLPVDGSYDVDLLRLADEASYRAKGQRTKWAFASREPGLR